jgi:hypothetical protein
MAPLVYLLCALTSTLCAIALLLKYRLSRVRLLLWSGWGFAGLAANNILLLVDYLMGSSADLSVIRTIPGAIALAIMIWGFVWDTA